MNFFYEAIDANGQATLGKMEAQNAAEVQQRLLQQGSRPLSIAPNPNGANAPATVPVSQRSTVIQAQTAQSAAQAVTTAKQTSRSTNGMILSGNAAQLAAKNRQRNPASPSRSTSAPAVANASTLGGVSTRDLMFFFQQLGTLVKSGMTINSALDNLGPRTRNQNLSRTALEMANAAKTGGKISDVMARYPRIYPEHIVGMVSAGELGGFLDIALAEITYNYEQSLALYKGMWWPVFLALQALFALPVGLPLFHYMLRPTLDATMDVKHNLIEYANATFFYTVLTVVLTLGLWWGSRKLQMPQFRRFRDNLSLRLPPFGDLQRQVALANFVRMLRRLYHAGVAPIQAWEGAMQTADNSVIRGRLASSYGMMQAGKSFAEAFEATGLFHDSVEQLVMTGQAAGQMPEMLDQAAAYYQERVEDSMHRVRSRMKLFGRLTMLVLTGILVIFMTKSCYSHIFEIGDSMMPQ